MDDCFYMKMALAEAQKAFDEDEIPIGAVIVCHDRVTAKTHNLTETLCDVTAHAEIQAITAASQMLGGKYLNDCTLFVTVEPCVMCAGAIVQSRMQRVVIASMNAKAGCAGSVLNLLQMKEFNHQVEITRGVLEEECSCLLSGFFKELRSRKKTSEAVRK